VLRLATRPTGAGRNRQQQQQHVAKVVGAAYTRASGACMRRLRFRKMCVTVALRQADKKRKKGCALVATMRQIDHSKVPASLVSVRPGSTTLHDLHFPNHSRAARETFAAFASGICKRTATGERNPTVGNNRHHARS
jgi:hypothetical protein